MKKVTITMMQTIYNHNFWRQVVAGYQKPNLKLRFLLFVMKNYETGQLNLK